MRTYGRYTLDSAHDRWAIQCEPQVSIRLKRVFERASKAPGIVNLAATHENAKELLWFLERYPMEPVRASDLDALRDAGAAYDRFEAAIAKVTAADYVPTNVELALPPRDYQRLPGDLAFALGGTAGVLCADAVGLGKTVEGICLFARTEARPALVVTLTHLPRQWEAEIHRFAPSLGVHVVQVGSPYRRNQPLDLAKKLARGEPVPDVIVISYSKIGGWAEFLAPFIRSVIYDEAQEFRSGPGYTKPIIRYAAGRILSRAATYRLGLTATPIYNRGGEMFNVVEILAPDVLGSKAEFDREWGGDVVRDPVALGGYLRERGIFVRRTRAEVGRELPPVQLIDQPVDCDHKPLEEIEGRAAELARFLLAGGGERGDAMRASEELSWRLRQATGIAKAPFVADYVRMIVESGEPVVLYGWHHGVYALWGDLLRDLRPEFYHGERTDRQKAESKRRFVDGETDLLICSLRSGAGLDGLQKRARYVVFGELDWSPALHQQCVGRLDRDGQESPEGVTAVFCIADTGSDPSVVDALGIKTGQLVGILDGNVKVQQGVRDLDRARTLARRFLQDRGLAVPQRIDPPKLDFSAPGIPA